MPWSIALILVGILVAVFLSWVLGLILVIAGILLLVVPASPGYHGRRGGPPA